MSILAKTALPNKGVFRGLSVGTVVIIDYKNGALYALRTEAANGTVQTLSMETGARDTNGDLILVNGVPERADYPLDGPLPYAPKKSEVKAYMEDHPLVAEMGALVDGVSSAKSTLLSKCAGDTEATDAMTLLINTYGF